MATMKNSFTRSADAKLDAIAIKKAIVPIKKAIVKARATGVRTGPAKVTAKKKNK